MTWPAGRAPIILSIRLPGHWLPRAHGSSELIRVLDDFRRTLYFRAEEMVFRHGFWSPYAHVAEFPKSGGSWVQDMAIDVMRRGQRSASSSLPRIIHHHWNYSPRFRPAIYVLRDGRDVVISLYFFHVRHVLLGSMWRGRVERYFGTILGPNYVLSDVKANLPAFIESLTQRPHGGTLPVYREKAFQSWPDHVTSWIGRDGVLVVRYEDLLEAPAAELRRIADNLSITIGQSELDAIAEAHSFRIRSGRSPGTEDRRSFLRRGIAGEWREYFTVDAGRAFSDYAGSTLFDLGYEDDPEWVDRLEPAVR